MTPRSLIGGHVFVTGGLAKGGLAYMDDIGAEMIQVFVTNPRGWALTPGKPEQDAKLAEAGVDTYVHVPYLANFGSPTPETLATSVAIVRYTLGRGREIGAKGVVVHTGSAVPQPRDDAMRQLREHLLPLLDEIPDDGPDLLLEPMAGQGAMLCATVQDLEPYLDALEWHPRVGVCLDTCHAFSAGHDLTAEGGVPGDVRPAAQDRARPAQADPRQRLQGRLRLQEGPPREHRRRPDRRPAVRGAHAPPAVAGVPICIETPGKADQHRADIATLKRLRDEG